MWEVLETMRVISQNGTIDVPYENFVFSILNNGGGYGIVAVKNVAEPPEVFLNSLIATYSTEAKAIKAMEMLREAYTGKPKLNVDEIPNLAPREFGEKLGIGDILLYDKTNADVSFSSNYYFKFPQDNEIEV